MKIDPLKKIRRSLDISRCCPPWRRWALQSFCTQKNASRNIDSETRGKTIITTIIIVISYLKPCNLWHMYFFPLAENMLRTLASMIHISIYSIFYWTLYSLNHYILVEKEKGLKSVKYLQNSIDEYLK